MATTNHRRYIYIFYAQRTYIYNKAYLYQPIDDSYVWRRSVIWVWSVQYSENNIHSERSGPSRRKRSRPRMNVVITLASIFPPRLLVIRVGLSDIQSLARFLVRRALKFTRTVSHSPRNLALKLDDRARMRPEDPQSHSADPSRNISWYYIHIRGESAISLYTPIARDWRSCLGSRDAKIRSLS